MPRRTDERHHGAMVSLLLVLALAAHGGAAEEPARHPVAEILEAGWEDGLSARSALDAAYERAAAAGDPRVTYAFALALMRQGRYREALQATQQAPGGAPDLQLTRARVWLLALTREHAAALAEAEQLARLTAAEGVDRAAIAAFLGRIVGYLEGPAAGSVNADLLARRAGDIARRLDDSSRPAFDDARLDVVAEFSRFDDTRRTALRRDKEAAEAERQRRLDEVAAQREAIQRRTRALTAQQQELAEQVQSNREQLADEDQPLREEFERLEDRALLLNREVSSIASEMVLLESQLDFEEDPFRRDRLIREINRLSLLQRRYDSELLTLRRRAIEVNSERNDLLARHRRTQSELAGQQGRLAQDLETAAKLDRRNDIDERRIKRARTGIDRRTRALTAQAAALTTYLPFPLERERLRLLDSLVK